MGGVHTGNIRYLEQAVEPSDKVLDLGTNTGKHMDDLNCETVSTDLEFVSTDCDTEYCLADGTRMPFQSDIFDYILCNQVLEHVPDTGAIVAEIARLLKPGGEAIFSFPNRLVPVQSHIDFPRWYSLLPRSIGVRLADYLLNGESPDYYRTQGHFLSPMMARYLLNKNFNDVDYTTFSQMKAFAPDMRTDGGSTVENTILGASPVLERIASLPFIGHILELCYPYVEYTCRNRE